LTQTPDHPAECFLADVGGCSVAEPPCQLLKLWKQCRVLWEQRCALLKRCRYRRRWNRAALRLDQSLEFALQLAGYLKLATSALMGGHAAAASASTRAAMTTTAASA
jgi:hypothetical protein